MAASVTALVVDDEIFFRRLLWDILEKGGITVVAEAANGDQAVEKYRQYRPDVTFMDIFMPEKNGLEAIREIMTLDPGAKILVCSALGFEMEVEAARSSGARQLIMKPFMDDEILSTVREVTGT
jgi:two-component system, chemotaxis family, chemotaxis protein CheY